MHCCYCLTLVVVVLVGLGQGHEDYSWANQIAVSYIVCWYVLLGPSTCYANIFSRFLNFVPPIFYTQNRNV